MTKDFLLRLTEEHYGAGAFPVYGRLLEEGRLRHITGAQFFRSILLEKKLNYNLVNSSRGK